MTLTNEQMIPNRFAKLARGRRLMSKIKACWAAGGFVRIGTATRFTDYKVKHADMIVMGKSGSLYVKTGKKAICIDWCSFQFSA